MLSQVTCLSNWNGTTPADLALLPVTIAPGDHTQLELAGDAHLFHLDAI